MAARKPTRQTISFGQEVTRLRNEAGLSRLDLAKGAAVSRSYIAQVENGTTRCRRDFATRLDQALGTDTMLTDAWDDIVKSSAYPKFFADFPEAEASAALLRAFENTLVYGLLQNEDYARALLVDDAAVSARMRRQSILSGDAPPTVCVVLDESVLHRLVGGPDVMRSQCEHLLAMSTVEHVQLQIAPIAYCPGVHAPFTLATQENGDEVVYLATLNGGNTSNDPADTLYACKAFATLQAHALSVAETRSLIRKVLKERWS
ncbi:helix-turn-helix domain-containing protein [Actinomadura madurae]|uniref:Helix-turn-helix domain-containing protein n=1 Tax=Actinomadura madurae TaxID=1993 RepID=A0A1I5DIP2_9ACTN|nr:helix-turn-helix transcriptional regulator [Actinomadura madurae]SFN99007.1 Helix-turn-helix domain-containing protein [Actinomadura madurae]SPT50333.1 Predicted transcriptional regulator [Actinomadura madurae]